MFKRLGQLDIMVLFSLPVQSTGRAIVLTLASAFTFALALALKFCLSPYLNNHSSETFQIWSMDTLEGLLSFHESRP